MEITINPHKTPLSIKNALFYINWREVPRVTLVLLRELLESGFELQTGATPSIHNKLLTGPRSRSRLVCCSKALGFGKITGLLSSELRTD